MSLKLRRGDATSRKLLKFDIGEPIWDTTENALYIGDGIETADTMGGIGSVVSFFFTTTVVDTRSFAAPHTVDYPEKVDVIANGIFIAPAQIGDTAGTGSPTGWTSGTGGTGLVTVELDASMNVPIGTEVFIRVWR